MLTNVLVSLLGSSPDFGFWLHILVGTCSARVSESGLDLFCSHLNFWFPASVLALVRLPGSSPDSRSRFLVSDSGLDFATLASQFLAASPAFVRSTGFSADSSFRFQIPVWTFCARFSVSGFGWALVRLPSSSLDSGFGFPVSDSGLDAPVSSPCLGSRAIAWVQHGFLVSGFRDWLALAPLASVRFSV